MFLPVGRMYVDGWQFVETSEKASDKPFVHGVHVLGGVDVREWDVRHRNLEELAERPPPLLHREFQQR